MKNNLLKKIYETTIAMLPMVVLFTIIFLVSTYSNVWKTNGDNPTSFITTGSFVAFIICAFVLAIGNAFFQFGADNALHKIGTLVGRHLSKLKSISIIALINVFLGILITIAEPDLSMFANIVGKNSFPVGGNWIIKIVAGIGVGTFLVIGLLRIMLQKSIKYVIYASYVIIFSIAAIFGPEGGQTYLSISYDTSGVTTGPATVPFIISFGIAIASSRGGKDTSTDSFGMTGIMSLGPVITMLLLSFTKPKSDMSGVHIEKWDDLLKNGYIFWQSILNTIYGVVPLFGFFLLYNFCFIKVNKTTFIEILVGFGYTFIGLYLFLIAAEVGLHGIGVEFGINATNSNSRYLLIIFGLAAGAIIVLCEPAIQILSKQVEEISNGAIGKKTLFITLSIGVGLTIALEICRNLFWNGFSSYYLIIPIYIVILVLMLFVPDIYTSIAFDSGGIASGIITTALVMPTVVGMCKSLSIGSTVSNGFGIIGMIASLPILAVQLLGLSAKLKNNHLLRTARRRVDNKTIDAQIINFGA